MSKFSFVVCLMVGLSAFSNTASAQFFSQRNQKPIQPYVVTATASYRPVDVPGTQRIVAQQDAERNARQIIQNYVGSVRLQDGRTVNDVLVRNSKLKARVMEVIRKAEVVDTKVAPRNASVQVWVQIDLNDVWAVINSCE